MFDTVTNNAPKRSLVLYRNKYGLRNFNDFIGALTGLFLRGLKFQLLLCPRKGTAESKHGGKNTKFLMHIPRVISQIKSHVKHTRTHICPPGSAAGGD